MGVEATKKAGKQHISVRTLALLSVLSVMMIVSQVAMAALPNIELVSLLIILATVFFGWQALYAVVVFILVEGLLYGFSLWFFTWLYLWPILVALTMLFRSFIGASPFGWALLSGAYGLLFGFFYAVVYLPIGGLQSMLAYWVAGFLFDIAHCVGNFVLCLVLFKPLYLLLSRLTSVNPNAKVNLGSKK